VQLAPANQGAADFEKRFVDAGQSFVADSQATKPMQPSDGTFHHPTCLAQAATVLSSTSRDLGLYASVQQCQAMRFRIVAAVSLKQLGLTLGSAALASDGRDGIHQGQQLRYVVAIGLRQDYRKGNALRIGKEVMLGAGTTAIGRVRSRFFPAPRARMEELSATAREKSMRSAWRSLESSTWCNRSHTLARCHALSRRQQVLPEPHPISRGSIFQGMPERSTNTIPVSAARSVTAGRRPGFFLRRLLGRGRSLSIMFHNSSSISGLDIAPLRGKQCQS